MKLSAAAFNRHLAAMGQSVTWRRSSVCPCVSESTGAPKATCPMCSGKGRWWEDSESGVAAVAGQEIQREWAEMGMWESGDVVLTIPSDSSLYEAGMFDRVTLMNAPQPFSLTMVRNGSDMLRFAVADVLRVYWLNTAGNAVVEGGVPTVAADGSMTWATGEPPSGVKYSIIGRQYPEFFVFSNFGRTRATHYGEKLPLRLVIRRFDLYGR